MWRRDRSTAAVAVLLGGLATLYLVASTGTAEGVDGAEVYAARCGICHDVEGAIGTELTAAVVASYGTTANLFRYLRLAMPYEQPGSLSAEQYWAAVEHLARTRGLVSETVSTDELRGGSLPLGVDP